MKPRYYIIFYRPEGSTTWTPVGEFHNLPHNLFLKSYSADKVMTSLKEMRPEHEYEVFVCKPCNWVTLSDQPKEKSE